MLKSSFKKTISIIKKNKHKVFFIFLIQIIFLLALSTITLKTLNPAMQRAQNIMEYYDSINVTETSGMFGYLGDDPLIIYNNYAEMMNYLTSMAIFSSITIVILSGLIWIISNKSINKNSIKKDFKVIIS